MWNHTFLYQMPAQKKHMGCPELVPARCFAWHTCSCCPWRKEEVSYRTTDHRSSNSNREQALSFPNWHKLETKTVSPSDLKLHTQWVLMASSFLEMLSLSRRMRRLLVKYGGTCKTTLVNGLLLSHRQLLCHSSWGFQFAGQKLYSNYLMQYKVARAMSLWLRTMVALSEELSPQIHMVLTTVPCCQGGSLCYRPSFPRVGFRVVHCEKLSIHRTNENVIKQNSSKACFSLRQTQVCRCKATPEHLHTPHSFFFCPGWRTS